MAKRTLTGVTANFLLVALKLPAVPPNNIPAPFPQ
eukprot:CAMPEP_0119114574 /NCGR_PEP_ID=MMETSP1180-20130426/47901_1 /TAXON_ID=3052 ORGANISM="Chlamydomonas cf sp, Strain CCMP681" /NCGR_SAMPLE_ID=MMETSP1180 /ASSEMBLY_ACC=CAM_ASM_000741 /LENGTH=34 /DNA_ID= /DNA_START= /DNA_END= /DNA_ORIENTATION=